MDGGRIVEASPEGAAQDDTGNHAGDQLVRRKALASPMKPSQRRRIASILQWGGGALAGRSAVHGVPDCPLWNTGARIRCGSGLSCTAQRMAGPGALRA